MVRAFLLLTVSFSICININAQTSNWELEKDENGIQVYTRKTDASPIKEFKAITVINSDLESLIEILSDVKNYPTWMSDCKKAETLKKVNDSIRYDYIEVSVPWPLENRDAIFMYVSQYSDSLYISRLIYKPRYKENIEGITRLKKAQGKWVLSVIDTNKIEVTYQFFGDPGVSIPSWIINMFIVDGPHNTLSNLVGKLE